MRYRDQGPEVQALQLSLLARGYPLPRYGADGHFGRETKGVLARFASDRGIRWRSTSEVPAELLGALGLESATAPEPHFYGDVDLEGVELFDLRHEQTDPHPKSKKDKHGRTVRRHPAAIDSIVLHQAAIKFGGGDGISLARRSLGVACHAMAFHPGFVAWPADPLWYIEHANALNSRSLGLEVDGLYPGEAGGKTWNGKPATELTPEVIHAARMGVKLLVSEGRRLGCPIKYIYAHCQADSWRSADPGEGLWRAVAIDYAVPVLGLEVRPMETFRNVKGRKRDGVPIPEAWMVERVEVVAPEEVGGIG